MATASSSGFTGVTHGVRVIRVAVATGVALAAIFVLCWIGTLMPFGSPTHAYISLFTNAEISSGQALFEGTCWSLLFGLLSGAVFAVVYNATAALDRQGARS